MTNWQKGKPWSAEEDAILIRMVSEGCQNVMISNAISGRTTPSVKSRKETLGLTDGMSPWSIEEDERLKKFHLADLPWREIEKLIGRNKNACIGRARTLGLPSRGSKHVVAKKKQNPKVLKFEIKQHDDSSISIMEMNGRTCTWPVAEDPNAEVGLRIRFCGACVPLGITVCQKHAPIAFTEEGMNTYRKRLAYAASQDPKFQALEDAA